MGAENVIEHRSWFDSNKETVNELLKKCYGWLDVNGNPFFHSIKTLLSDAKVCSFCRVTTVKMIRGRIIVVTVDGTFSVVLKDHTSGQKKFDNVDQLVIVHVLFRKRNYLIGYFLVPTVDTDIAIYILSLVKEWLGPETTVTSVISDYEEALRNGCFGSMACCKNCWMRKWRSADGLWNMVWQRMPPSKMRH